MQKSRRERYDVRGDVVRAWGLEPQRRKAREPKSRMSTNSIMPANRSGRVTLPLFCPLFLLGEEPRGGACRLSRVDKNRHNLLLPSGTGKYRKPFRRDIPAESAPARGAKRDFLFRSRCADLFYHFRGEKSNPCARQNGSFVLPPRSKRNPPAPYRYRLIPGISRL